MPMSVSGMSTSKTTLLSNFLAKYVDRKLLKTLATNPKLSLYIRVPDRAAFSHFVY